ncbi:glycine--tRNA ligase [Candidatus Woesearchaeota archaeon]|nr:glycine--tRNA ligase [Candidatus Woesearchaeota archaeon]
MVLSIDEMTVFCKKKGFVYQTGELYGGLSGFYDYGHLGVELKNNIKALLWKHFVQDREDVVGIDGSIITHPKVWQASGHVECFTDILLECKQCHTRFRADHIIEEKLKIHAEGLKPEDINKIVQQNKLQCEKCKGELTGANPFHLMLETNIGPVTGNTAYLRPETAQLIFTNFKLVQEHARMKLPFGIAQQGKAFRNEISPRDFLFRMREFEQFEIEFFTHPKKTNDCPFFSEVENIKVTVLLEKDKEHKSLTLGDLTKKSLTNRWHLYWLGKFYQFFLEYGIQPGHLRLRQHSKSELAHYAKACFDIEYQFPFGWKEIHGNADRGQFDLEQHQKFSKQDMQYFDQEGNEKVLPAVAAEPSQGIERAFLAFLFDAYEYSKERENIVLHVHPKLAPMKVGVFPLINKLDKEALTVFQMLKKEFPCQFDRSGSIGRRYARADEIGIPYCITVDFDSAKGKDVTLRDRETTKQKRIKSAQLAGTIKKLLQGEIQFADL